MILVLGVVTVLHVRPREFAEANGHGQLRGAVFHAADAIDVLGFAAVGLGRPLEIGQLVHLAHRPNLPDGVNRRGRMNFPNTHYLNQGGNLLAQADVILGLEVGSTWGLVNTIRDRVHQAAPTGLPEPGVEATRLRSGV